MKIWVIILGIGRGSMKQFWKNLKGWQKGGIVFGFLAVILIVVISVINIINSEPKVEINFAEKTNIPGKELREIRTILVGVIKRNTENFDGGTIYKGNARDYEESVSGDFTTANFIVDFDEIKESYAVAATWPDPDDGSPNINVSCPLLESKYPETPCSTEINSSSDIVGYLPYEGEVDGKKYQIVGNYDSGKFYVEIQVDSCGDKALLDKVLVAAKQWISSIYLNPDDYLLYIPGDICSKTLVPVDPPYIQANHAETNDKNVNKYLPYFIPDAYNIYPVVDENNDVTSIKAKVPGCYEYQMESGKEFVKEYLKSNGIDYPVEFEKCEE